MKKIMFDDRFGLTQAVIEGRKTMTRRIIILTEADKEYLESAFDWDLRESVILDRYAGYKVGETVAVAQRYLDLCNCDAFYKALEKADPTFPLECIKYEKGCYNKMFVKSEWMPHRIRITGIKVERLQDISDEDCMKEGIKCITSGCVAFMPDLYNFEGCEPTENWKAPREAFADLIERKIGKGSWERNSWVLAYSFELVKGDSK